jgi:hypothetical protein
MNITRFGTGLTILGVGLALALGLPPNSWTDMPPELVHIGVGTGIVLIIVGLAITVSAFPRHKSVNTWGPWVIIIGGPLLGMLWFYLAREQKLPGFTAYAVIRLYDTPESRRRYVFEFVSSEGAKVSFYLSASSVFTFAATDIRGEAYPLEIKLGDGGIPIDQFVTLFCEIGIAKNSTVMRILVNEKQVARRDLSFPLKLGTMDWKPGTLGIPVTGINQGGVFLLSEIGIYPTTMTSKEVHALVDNAAGFYNEAVPTLTFDRSHSLRGAAPGKFYSTKDKENLADLCTELIGFLRENGGAGGGSGAFRKLAALDSDWTMSRGASENLTFLDKDLAEASAAVQSVWDGLYGDSGFLRKYDAYHDELAAFFPAPDYPDQIRAVQSAVNEFGQSVNMLVAEKDKRNRPTILATLEPSHEKYIHAIQQFQKVLFESTQRVEAFRKQM